MIDHNDLLIFSRHDMIAGGVSVELSVHIDNRIYVIAASQHFGTDIFCQLVCIKCDDFILHNFLNRGRKENVAGGIHRSVTADQNRAVIQFGCLNDIV